MDWKDVPTERAAIESLEAARVEPEKDIVPPDNPVAMQPRKTIFPVLAEPPAEVTFEPVDPSEILDLSVAYEDHLAKYSERLRGLTPSQRKELDRTMWSEAFQRERKTLSDLLPYRIQVARRLIFQLAWVRGLLSWGHSMTECLRLPGSSDSCPWMTPISSTAPREAQRSVKLRALVAEGMHPLYPDLRSQGLPLLVPRDFRARELYCEALGTAADELGVIHGSARAPLYGKYGLYGLLDPNIVEKAMPSPMQILALDDVLINETVDQLGGNSRRKVTAWHRDAYGFAPHESSFLIAAAQGRARMLTEADVEENRAVMVLKLEDTAERAREANDIRAELAALKNIAIIQGLNQNAGKDPDKEFMKLIRESASRDKGRITRGDDDDE